VTVIRELSVLIKGDSTQLDQALSRSGQSVTSWGQRISRGVGSAGQTLTGLGVQMGALAAPLLAFGVAGVNTAATFESSMNEISARTGLVGDDLKRVRDYALEMGAETSFSAQQASDAFLQLLSSGQDVEQAMATLPSVLNLAAAGGLELGASADLVTDVMAQFGIAVAAVPANFTELQRQLGVTDQMFTDFGNTDDASAELHAFADSLGVTTSQAYEMWNATKPLTTEMQALASSLGITAADWIAYGDSVSNITPGISTLIDQTGLAGGRLSEMFTGAKPEWFVSQLEDVNTVVDALSQAAGSSSATVDDLAQGFKSAGPVANLFGMSVRETAATLAVLSENGIKGAEGGTALKSMLLNLVRPTKEVDKALKELGVSMYDANGDVRDFDSVIDDLDTALDRLPMDDQIRLSTLLAGSYGITAFSALRASGGIDTMLESMDGAASASVVAEARMKGFSGSFDSLKGSVETLMIQALTPFMENVLTPMVQKLTPVVNAITDWVAENPELISQIGTATLGVAALAGALTITGTALMLLGKAAGLALSPVGLLVAAIALTDWNKAAEGSNKFTDGLQALSSGEIEAGIQGVTDGLGAMTAAIPPGQAADSIINALNSVAGTNFAGVEQGIGSWGTAFLNMGTVVSLVFDDLRRRVAVAKDDIERFFTAIQLRAQIANTDVMLANPLLGGGDRERIGAERLGAIAELQGLEFGENMRAGIDRGLAMNAIDLSYVTFEGTDAWGQAFSTTLEMQLAAAAYSGDYSGLAKGLGEGGKWAIARMMETLRAAGNYEDLSLLLPLALELGLDVSAVRNTMVADLVAGLMGTEVVTDIQALPIVSNLSAALGMIANVVSGQRASAQVMVDVALQPIIASVAPLGAAAGAVSGFFSGLFGSGGSGSPAPAAVGGGLTPDGSHAGGLDYVPKDGYLARLHRGEQVLTAEDAARRRRGEVGNGGGGTHITVNSAFTGTVSELVDMIERELSSRGR
jgi:TP901 family phage tail tape measure protein